MDDVFDISVKVDQHYRELAYNNDSFIDFSDVRQLENAYYLRGEYHEENGQIVLRCLLKQNKEIIGESVIRIANTNDPKLFIELDKMIFKAIQN